MSDALAARERIHGLPVRSLSTVSPEPNTLFHKTPEDALDSICTEGILGEKEKSYRGETEQFIKDTLAELGYSLLFDRQNAVFCWPTLYEPFGPGHREVLLEIDFTALETPVYAADFSHSTEVVCGYEESRILHGIPPAENEELKQHVRHYADSVTRVETWVDIQNAIEEYKYAELLVADRVPPAAIQSVSVPEETDDAVF